MHDIRRRRLLKVAAAALVPSWARAQAHAPLRLVVGFPAGGVVDVTARALADGWRTQISSAVIVENRPGAGGRIAVETVKAAADGTLLYSPPSVFTLYPHIYQDLAYDSAVDFNPVWTVCSYPFALAIHAGLPPKSLAEFVAWAKGHPAQAVYATPGPGTIQHFLGMMLSRASRTPLTHVPYKGGGQSIADLVSGALAASISVAQLYLPHHRSGRVRVLGISGARRLAALAAVPTFAELGYADMVIEEWFGVFAPARAGASRVAQLSAEIDRAVASATVQQTLARLEYTPFVMGPVAAARAMSEERERWAAVVQRTGFTRIS